MSTVVCTEKIDFKLELLNFYTLKSHFSISGLRTLCIASADVTEEFYDEWKHTYYKASTSLQNRDKKLEEAAELIERVQINNIHLTIDSCFSCKTDD